MEMNPPRSCDTFVVLPPGTAKGTIVFGKNSDRPSGEVQEVVYYPASDYNDGDKLQCTYIEIDQASRTHAVILSKPAWMWGAEMGANEHGVCIGNEAVWTKLNGPQDGDEKLLGMDLLRLGLERGNTAKEALEIITKLLEEHGQGGPCSDTIDMTYHNSFLIVDQSEAWVLETANDIWAAEQITSGYRNISNCLSIGTKIDLHSSNLHEYAKSNGLWDDSQGDLNFTKVYGDDMGDDGRYTCGKELLRKLSESGQFKEKDMFSVLRDKDSGICMSDGGFRSTGSQVSVLSPKDSSRPACHWFTGTPDPLHSVFKPFIFSPNVRISRHIISPTFPDNEDPAKVTPRFKSKVDRRHNLYKHHEKAYNVMKKKNEAGENLRATMSKLEQTCIQDVENFLDSFKDDNTQEVEDLFKDVVETEIKFYK